MTEPDGFETLHEYERVANQLLAASERDAVKRAVRVLALYVGHYQLRYGPIDTAYLAALNSTSPSAEQIADRVEAMRVLAAALAVAVIPASDADDARDGPLGPV
jgi:hypothetical protein